MDISALKSGTDLRGVGSGEGVTLTDEAVYAAVSAFAVWLREKTCKVGMLKVALGHDSRISGERICAAAENALKAAGCEIYSAGLCSTPSMFMMTKFEETDCDGSIMITASHHPANRNGLKFFTKSGGIDSCDLDRIIAYAGENKAAEGKESRVLRKDYMKLYKDFLVKRAREISGEESPLDGMKICIDAGGGAGGFFADVLGELGADTSSSQFLEPDGTFSHHIPNPENEGAMASLSERVKTTGSDLGVIFDADVDRAAIAAADGSEINRNRLIALVSAVLLEERKGGTIVTDSVTSDGLKEFITARGGVHRRFKRGYRNVINEALRLEGAGVDVPLAIETSGHAALKENFFLDDGAYLSLRLVIAAARLAKEGKSLTDLIDELKTPKESREIRLGISGKDFLFTAKEVLRQLESVAGELEKNKMCVLAKDSFEGVRVNMDLGDGFFLARCSVHDPVIVINIESNETGGVKKIAGFLSAFFGSYSALECTDLKTVAENG